MSRRSRQRRAEPAALPVRAEAPLALKPRGPLRSLVLAAGLLASVALLVGASVHKVRDLAVFSPPVRHRPASADPTAAPRARATPTERQVAGAQATTDAETAIRDEVTGLRLAGVEVSEGRTRIHLTWDRPDAADVIEFMLQRRDQPAGSWSTVQTLPPGERGAKLDLVAPLEWFRVGVRRSVGVTYGQPIRAAAVSRSGYQFGDQVVPAAPFHKAVVWGMVHAPVALAAPEVAPLVLLVHGNNGVCRGADGRDACDLTMIRERKCPEGSRWTPNGEGLAWLADTLAAAGMVAVVLDVNTTNCAPLPTIVVGRAALVLEHLRLWRNWATAGGEPFDSRWVGRVDLTRVAIVGHSNGAEAAVLLPDMLTHSRRDPNLQGVRLGAIVSVASTDSLEASVEDTAMLTVLASCDQQLSLMEGKRLHDRSLPDRQAPLAEVLMVGANHNGFNTQWLVDERLDASSDSDLSACPLASKLSGGVQRRLLGVLATSFLDAILRRRGPIEGFMRADQPTPTGVVAYTGREVDLRWSYADPERIAIDNFDHRDASLRNAVGGLNQFTDFDVAARCFATDCDPEFEHPVWAARLQWQQPGARALFRLGQIDAMPYTALSFRAAQCLHGGLNPDGEDMDFAIRLTDQSGNEAVVWMSEAGRLPYPSTLARSRPKLLYMREQLHTVRVPLALFAARNPLLNLRAIGALSLEMTSPAHGAGAVILTQLELTR
mgnify:CR=1 FL=1